MKVGVPRETTAGERRVALVPETVKRLTGSGFEVIIERAVYLGKERGEHRAWGDI